MNEKTRIILYVSFLFFFCIDTFVVGVAYSRVVDKVNAIAGTRHMYRLTPLINIILFKYQIELFKEVPEFTMNMFWDTLKEVTIFWIVFVSVTSVFIAIYMGRGNKE